MTERRMKAVRLRLDGHTIAETCRQTGLSAPTVSAAWKAFKSGGWDAVPLRSRGRPSGRAAVLGGSQQQALWQQLAAQPPWPLPAWNSKALAEWLKTQPAPLGSAASPRAIEHWWASKGLVPTAQALDGLASRRSVAGRWYRQQVQPAQQAVERAGGLNWQGGVRVVPAQAGHSRGYQLYLYGKRGVLHMRCLAAPPRAEDYLALFERISASVASCKASLVFHGAWFQASPEVKQWLTEHPELQLLEVPPDTPRSSTRAKHRKQQ